MALELSELHAKAGKLGLWLVKLAIMLLCVKKVGGLLHDCTPRPEIWGTRPPALPGGYATGCNCRTASMGYCGCHQQTSVQATLLTSAGP